MSNEMIEQVVKAIEKTLDGLSFSGGPKDGKIQYNILGKAAIVAMREPTDQQRNNYYNMFDIVFYDAVWEKSIDASLKDN